MDRAEMESRDEAVKSKTAIRCAKVAFLLSSLKSFHNRHLGATVDQQAKEKEELRKAVRDLKVELARARQKNKRIKLCGLMEFILQLLLVISLSSFFLLIAFNLLELCWHQ